MNMFTTLSIFFAVNDAYMGILATCIASTLTNSTKLERFHFYVLHGGIQEENKKLLEQLKAIKEFQITYIKVTPEDFKAVPDPTVPRISQETNYRLQLTALEPNLDKILFLDADLIVVNSLLELWNTDISSYYMACVTDQYALTPDSWVTHLRLPDDYVYVNTGVMLVNLEKWRKDGVQKKFFETAELFAPVLRFPDQDILNITLHKAILQLNHKWNFMPVQHYLRLDQQKEALTDTRIIHWAGEIKPWERMAPYGERFWRFACLTPFYENLWMRFIWLQSESIGQLHSKIERLDVYRYAIHDFVAVTLFCRHQIFRLLAKVTFGKIRARCVRRCHNYAKLRKTLKM